MLNRCSRILIASLILAGCAYSDQPHADQQAPSSQIERESPLARVGVIGASASAGFLAMFPDHPIPVSYDRAFEAVLAEPGQSEVFGHSTAMFFSRAWEIGPTLMDQALAHEPTLLVAIDYLFWFGYGHLDELGRPLHDEQQRLDLLEFGLKQLERFDGPIVVGDFPDMSPAIGLMLARRQVPTPQTLETLNSRVQAWASERPNVIVMPLADMVRQIGEGEGLEMGERTWTSEQTALFVVADKLHPSPEGQIASVTIVADLMSEKLAGVEASDFDVDRERVLGRLKNQDNPQGSGG